MKKQVITVLITLLVVAVVEVGVFFVCKDYFLSSKEETNTEEKEPEEDNNTEEKELSKEEDSLVGAFAVTYTDKGSSLVGNLPSTLSIFDDGTYAFHYNNCDMFYTVKGNYEIKDNILTLVGSKNHRSEYLDEDISFVIVSPTEIYLTRDRLSCTIGSDEYQKGQGSFKKIY